MTACIPYHDRQCTDTRHQTKSNNKCNFQRTSSGIHYSVLFQRPLLILRNQKRCCCTEYCKNQNRPVKGRLLHQFIYIHICIHIIRCLILLQISLQILFCHRIYDVYLRRSRNIRHRFRINAVVIQPLLCRKLEFFIIYCSAHLNIGNISVKIKRKTNAQCIRVTVKLFRQFLGRFIRGQHCRSGFIKNSVFHVLFHQSETTVSILFYHLGRLRLIRDFII